MTDTWKEIDQIIETIPMPPDFDNAKALVLCNDCEQKTETKFHFEGLKCGNKDCGSYNTKIISTSGFPTGAPPPARQ